MGDVSNEPFQILPQAGASSLGFKESQWNPVSKFMTYRILIVGRRKEGMDHEACIEYLEQEHTPLVKDIPGLQRFTVSIPTNPKRADYDEVAELRFSNAEDLDTATSSEAWQQTMADAECFVNLEKSIMITVEDNQIDHRPVPEFV